jgi:hypothetical protein
MHVVALKMPAYSFKQSNLAHILLHSYTLLNFTLLLVHTVSCQHMGHSLGSCTMAAIIRDKLALVHGLVLIEPVCFLLYEVCNAHSKLLMPTFDYCESSAETMLDVMLICWMSEQQCLSLTSATHLRMHVHFVTICVQVDVLHNFCHRTPTTPKQQIPFYHIS